MPASSLLRVESISKTFGNDTILDQVSMEMQKGDLKVLIGPSGGGKSTLLQCINLLIFPDQGHIELNGQRISPRRTKDLLTYRQQIGMIFQDFNLFDHLTALDNVRIALRKVKKLSKAKATVRAERELERVGLSGQAGLYPAELSGGQKQRVSIARALAMDPILLLLDEPTSALDPELIGEVLAVIRDLSQSGMTMLMATHQMGFARTLAQEILFMERGRIIEQGAPAQLLQPGPGGESRTLDFCTKLSELYDEVQ
ncbi:amino acid ABC transporter ATP-binding protein [Desulfovermiculus halophilus]|jgi:polar amino acid transport system ATP-binding protein|uniref:amino acid ABC transporter ATP-binding protein n=1 Tax=Desulfovermiculus halophilus TaxID=339722 RepID=UPI0004854B9B|nr:amino acid ABC transporter ATP-binding protein [Desulfovermiculus halophilus]